MAGECRPFDQAWLNPFGKIRCAHVPKSHRGRPSALYEFGRWTYANAHVDTEQGEDAKTDSRDSYGMPTALPVQARP
jgi:hypothetical protein